MSGSNPVFGSLLDNVLPRVPPFFKMIHEQTEMLVRAFSCLVVYMESGERIRAGEVAAVETQATEFKDKMLEILNNAFSTPMDREDVYRAIFSIHEPIWSARVAAEEMDALGIKSDRFAVEMVTILREAAISLESGYGKMETHPAGADGDAVAASRCRLTVDKAYRRALASLYNVDETKSSPGADQPATMKEVTDVLKRREMYRHLHLAARQMAEAGVVLRGIVVQMS
ncbi:MAG: hypothetical protein HQL87_10625 [Magnetococcales bacterium]|nr:hypothetical protein [Magnetococcales bacterium]